MRVSSKLYQTNRIKGRMIDSRCDTRYDELRFVMIPIKR